MDTKQTTPIVFGLNLNGCPEPLISPTGSSPDILIIGGGVTGLVTAWVLLDRGYKVTIVAKEWGTYTSKQRLTSQIAGALWEFPPAACGQHTDIISLSHSRHWCMIAYKVWEAMAADPVLSAASGVRMRTSAFYFTSKIEDTPSQLVKMLEIQNSGVKGFRRNIDIIHTQDLNPTVGVVDAYEHLAPVIDTDTAMKWLMGLVQGKGAKLVTETIHGSLLSQEQNLRARLSADVIVNATGLAGAEIAGGNTCYPIRGALLRVINDGKDFEKVSNALVLTADDAGNAVNEMVFIVPRNENILLLGGIAQPNECNLDLTLDSAVIQRIRQRCETFLPRLKNARLDLEYPLAQGLRPFRKCNVRLERELGEHDIEEGLPSKRSRIVHSYGHGGAGWSLSFGCAEDAVGLIEDILREGM
ncbi:nucleotide-binding domain-containing protein [Mollisia scopiformis]|uniref:Nucleotide-binding domain-containing protein n=1 Tax=Mollisia scopiformis TaxID=149040 RepID=A0A194XKW5_MOLSC|nr:nucleotide-binding domain-containing protein [Mollisia scopiformis]KUJ20771.1 nucleotide-binding domain-containing protein [Mollisia scopiformis]